ncbi:hypothetical protein Bhyg_02309 [Pseudolycoriella hygida]|uniref:Uncharacterized protein n=1 Tax=Pseudolycoriella hygida TaxID=35572 RepID=A0A9Q0NCZ6_9DIPT|nr:hypothetical protein Bhyg_02309 [Pseudolycoriella hygida]
MLIFAGIYYQRERSRRKTRTTRCNNGHGSPVDGDIPLTIRPGSSPGKSKQEPPPSYTTLQRSPCTHRDKGTLNKSMCDAYKQQQQNIQSSQHHHTVTLCQNQHPKNASTKTHNPPQPPTRTSSNPPSSNVNQIENQLEHHTQVHQQQGGICGNNGSGVSELGSGSGVGCSSGTGASCKRRVQIQEITV